MGFERREFLLNFSLIEMYVPSDAGKSTIGGHIMYLTGMVDKRTLEKYEREAKEKNRESWLVNQCLKFAFNFT